MIKDSTTRVQKYLDRLATAKGYHKECIHTFITGDGEEISLLVSDLKELAQFALDSQRTALTDEQIMDLQEKYVGGPCPSYPLDASDWINFARAIECAHGTTQEKQ